MMNTRHSIPLGLIGLALILAVIIVFTSKHARHMDPLQATELEGGQDNPEGRGYFEWQRLHDPATGVIPGHARKLELDFASRLPQRAEFKGGMMKTDGAAGIMTTSWSQWGPTNVGGRSRALGIDVFNTNVIVAGGVSGGIWRSTDGGTSWVETTLPSQLHSVSCLAQDTRANGAGTWYCGTGEYLGNSANGRGGAFFQGDGIYKSTDNGASWALLSSTSAGRPQQWDSQFDYVWNVVIDPSNTSQSVMFAAVPGFILRSTNGGTTWATTLNASGGTYSYMTDVQVTSTGVVYATISNGSSNVGIWRSTDGISWTNITPTDMPTTVRRIVIAIAPSNESIVYFLAETPGAGYQTTYAGNNEAHSFWKYTYLSGDGSGSGGSWSNRSSNLPNFGQPVGNFASQGSYDLVIKVKPDDPNMVFFGGTDLFRSADGLATGSSVWIGGYATKNDVSGYTDHHADQHSLAFLPTSTTTLYSGHDGGLSVTSNDLGSPVTWSSLNNGYCTTQFYTIAIDRSTSGNNAVVGGAQDNGTWFSSSTTFSHPWVQEFTGDGAACAIAVGRSAYYISANGGLIYRVILDANGNTLDFARVDPTGGSGYLFIDPFVLDPSNTTVMYLAGGSSLWRNSGLLAIPNASVSPGTANSTTSVNWTNLTAAGVGSSVITALGVSTTTPSNRLYYGTNDGKVYRLDNANSATTSTNPVAVWTGKGLPAGAYVSCVGVDPANGDNAMLVFSNYSVISVYYTSDAGATWNPVAGNLEQNSNGTGNGPSVRWASILQFSGNTFYYLGTSTGLYSTTTLNGMSTLWQQEGASTIGNVVVDMIDCRGSDGRVVVATHGHGVFWGTASANGVARDDLRPVTTALLQNYPNPFNPSTTIRYTVGTAARVLLQVFDVAGKQVATLVNGERSPGAYDVRFAPTGLASGMYLYRLQVGNYTESKKLLYVR